MYNMYSVNSTGSLISSQELDALLADMPADLAKKLRLPSAPRDTFNFNYSNIGSPAARNLAYNFSATNPVRDIFFKRTACLSRCSSMVLPQKALH